MGTNVIATMVIGERHKKIFELTKDSIFKYAKKINVDLAIYGEDQYELIKFTNDSLESTIFPSNTTTLEYVDIPMTEERAQAYNYFWQENAFKKLRVVELLEKYERVLFIDCDIIITDKSPNIFEIVPKEKVGMYNESMFFENYRSETVKSWCEMFDLDYSKWDGSYYNSGVVLFSRGHELLYDKPKFFYKDMFYDQTHLNGNILEYNIPMFDLPYKFNRIFFIDQLVDDSRYESFFIHYAGSWYLLEESHNENPEYLLSVIKHDIDVLNKKIPMPPPHKARSGTAEKWWSI